KTHASPAFGVLFLHDRENLPQPFGAGDPIEKIAFLLVVSHPVVENPQVVVTPVEQEAEIDIAFAIVDFFDGFFRISDTRGLLCSHERIAFFERAGRASFPPRGIRKLLKLRQFVTPGESDPGPYPYHLHISMSKRDDSSGLDGARGRWFPLGVGALSAIWRWGAAVSLALSSSACRDEAATPEVSQVRPTATFVSPPRPPPGIGPTTPPREVWSTPLGAVIFAGPVLARGPGQAPVVYVGTLAGRFVGVAAEGEAAGSIVVERFLGGMVWTRAESDGAVLYVGADDDVLYALDPVTGASLWELRLGDCEPPRSHG